MRFLAAATPDLWRYNGNYQSLISMNHPNSTWLRNLLVMALVAAAWAVVPQDSGFAQEPVDDNAATAVEDAAEAETDDATGTDDAATTGGETPPVESTEEAPGDGGTPDESPADDPSTDAPQPGPDTPIEPAGEDSADTSDTSEESPTDETPSGDAGDTDDATTAGQATSETGTADEDQQGTLSFAMILLLVVAVIAVPVLVGSSMAKSLKMPDHGWKITTVLTTLLAGTAVVVTALMFDNFKFGPDLAGGITLIYELEDATQVVESGDVDSDEGEGSEADDKKTVNIDRLVERLKLRVDPAGTKEVIIRPYGKAIEIIIPKAGEIERDRIKKTITALGALEFRITVDRNRSEHQEIIRLAESLPPGKVSVRQGGDEVAKWVEYKTKEFGELNEGTLQGLVKRMGVKGPEALVLLQDYNVTGDYLTSTTKGTGPKGWEVRFRFNASGAKRFGKLTGSHLPTAATRREYFLGIILDNRLLSAPSINGRITTEGTISGSMTEQEVQEIVDVLEAGSLPTALNTTPISETEISPTIGKETIEQATFAMSVSMAIVVVFMIFYYRFAGIVAVLALALNVLLVLAVMVLIGAAFTLPGLAGLVLTVGMSVDANVLVFERIREELNRGAALRMAIRNGFARAFTTIWDANITTLIVGLVLYTIGTDTIKGFAVTLILGIVMSMYTAVFCSRLVFDIAERRGWLQKLSMARLVGNHSINFLGMAPPAMAVSVLLIAVGLAGAFGRSTSLFDIDFTGGTSVTIAFRDDATVPYDDVRTILESEESGLGGKERSLTIVERGTGGRSFTVTSSIQSVDEVQAALTKSFGDKLATYSLVVGDIKPASEGDAPATTAVLTFGKEGDEVTATNYETVADRLQDALAENELEGVVPLIENPNLKPGSSQRFNVWNVTLSLDQSQAQAVFDTMQSKLNAQPIFPLANKIGGRVASEMQSTAVYAIVVSLLGIVGYIWFRFQKISYGLAAVIALVHDVLFALGIVAASAYVVSGAGGLATLLKIDAFQISLTIVAAFLTIIGYSLNDTIVVFDRIREVRGKSPHLSREMINTSINQTLGRTLLTSLTTLIVVAILYWSGGPGVHGFAFTLLVGIIVGTYSSIFIASPALLWLSGLEDSAPADSRSPKAAA